MSIANTTLGTGWSPGSPNSNKKGGLGNLSLASDPLLLRLVRPLCVNEY